MPTIGRRGATRTIAHAGSEHRTLLDGWSPVREWGRIGRAGRLRTDPHGDLTPARAAAEWLAARKRGRGIGESARVGGL